MKADNIVLFFVDSDCVDCTGFFERPLWSPFPKPAFSTMWLSSWQSSSYNQTRPLQSYLIGPGWSRDPVWLREVGILTFGKILHPVCLRVCIKWNGRLFSGLGFHHLNWRIRKIQSAKGGHEVDTQRKAEMTDGERTLTVSPLFSLFRRPSCILVLRFPEKTLCNKSPFTLQLSGIGFCCLQPKLILFTCTHIYHF